MPSIAILVMVTILSTWANLIQAAPASVFACGETDQCLQDFRNAGAQIPKQLLDNGIEELGRLDLKALVEFIETASLVPRPWVSFPDGNDHERISAIWHRDTTPPYIEFNLAAWDATKKEVKPLIALHEFLQLLDFNDQDYQLSLSLWFLLETQKKQLLSPDQSEWLQDQILLLAGGGAVGVGGGGDFNAEWLKLTIIKNAIEKINGEPTQEQQQELLQTYLLSRSIKLQMSYPQVRPR